MPSSPRGPSGDRSTMREKQFYVTRHFAEGVDVDTAPPRDYDDPAVAALPLPGSESGPFDDFDAASWLAFSLWDSIPDQQLLDAAGRGQLKTADQLTRQAERMLQSPKARAKVSDLHRAVVATGPPSGAQQGPAGVPAGLRPRLRRTCGHHSTCLSMR